ncbi:transposase [Escherichia coli]|nr:transposase [Escherichia coli]
MSLSFEEWQSRIQLKFCRTDTGSNSGNGIVNGDAIFKMTILLQKIEMCFSKILYIFLSFSPENDGTNSQQ